MGEVFRATDTNAQQDISVPGITLGGRIFSSYDTPQGMLGELKLPAGGIDAVRTPTEMTLLAEVDHFQMSGISPGGSWISGFDSENGVASLYSMETGVVVQRSLDGIPVNAS
jgi:hypothetical protein